jgi:hypothetical protein
MERNGKNQGRKSDARGFLGEASIDSNMGEAHSLVFFFSYFEPYVRKPSG